MSGTEKSQQSWIIEVQWQKDIMAYLLKKKWKKVSSLPRNRIVSSLMFNQRQRCTISVLRAASCSKGGFSKSRSESYLISFCLRAGRRTERAAEAHAWLLGGPPTNRLQRREGGCGPHQWGPLLERAEPREVSLQRAGIRGWGWSWRASDATVGGDWIYF